MRQEKSIIGLHNLLCEHVLIEAERGHLQEKDERISKCRREP
jgi:hypothetical protein